MRTIFVVDDEGLASLPPITKVAAIGELTRVFAFVGQVPKEPAMTVSVMAPSSFPEALDLSDAVVRLTVENMVDPELQAAIRKQVANATRDLRAANVRSGDLGGGRLQARPERNGVALQIKTVPNGTKVALSIMASVVTLPGSAESFATDSTQPPGQIERRRRRLRDQEGNVDIGRLARYFGSAQSLTDVIDTTLHENPSKPGAWPTGKQQHFGVYLGRAMAHEARHLYVPAHAATGLGTDGPDPLDDKNYGSFSRDDQKQILTVIRAFERRQKGTTLIRTFPKDARQEADSFPF